MLTTGDETVTTWDWNMCECGDTLNHWYRRQTRSTHRDEEKTANQNRLSIVWFYLHDTFRKGKSMGTKQTSGSLGPDVGENRG